MISLQGVFQKDELVWKTEAAVATSPSSSPLPWDTGSQSTCLLIQQAPGVPKHLLGTPDPPMKKTAKWKLCSKRKCSKNEEKVCK